MACTSYENGSDAKVVFTTTAVPSNSCFDSPQALVDLVSQYLVGSLPGSFSGFVIGSSTPAVSDQGKGWWRTTTGCAPMGLYQYYNGMWRPVYPTKHDPGEVICIYDVTLDPTDHTKNAQILSYRDCYDETYSPGTYASNPFWRYCDGTNGTPDLRGRTIIGAGAGTAPLTDRKQGDLVGDETVTLQQSEIPNLAVPIGTSGTGGLTQSGTNAGTLGINSSGGGSHNNMQPSLALYYIMRTSRTV